MTLQSRLNERYNLLVKENQIRQAEQRLADTKTIEELIQRIESADLSEWKLNGKTVQLVLQPFSVEMNVRSKPQFEEYLKRTRSPLVGITSLILAI